MNLDLFTPTQQKVLTALADGQPHSLDELRACLPDAELGSKDNVRNHVGAIRKLLHTQGEDVVCRYAYRKYYYQWVKLRGSAAEGKRATFT